MKPWKIDKWLTRGIWITVAVIAVITISHTIESDRRAKERNRIPGHFLGDVGGVPLLVPDVYLANGPVHDGHLKWVDLWFDLPDVGPGGKSAESEWRIGRPRLLSVLIIGAPEGLLQANMTRGEYYAKSVVNFLEDDWADMPPEVRDFDFAGLWEKFRQENQDRDYELIDAGDVFDWNAEQTQARGGDTITHIMFAGRRIVLFGRCDKPDPGISPHCDLRFHEPQSPVEMDISFNRIHQDQTLAIIRKVQQRLREFNQAAREQGYRGPAWPPPTE